MYTLATTTTNTGMEPTATEILTNVMKIGKRGSVGSKTEANGRSRSRARKAKREREREENEKNDSSHQKKVNAITKLEMGRNEHCFLGQSI